MTKHCKGTRLLKTESEMESYQPQYLPPTKENEYIGTHYYTLVLMYAYRIARTSSPLHSSNTLTQTTLFDFTIKSTTVTKKTLLK